MGIFSLEAFRQKAMENAGIPDTIWIPRSEGGLRILRHYGFTDEMVAEIPVDPELDCWVLEK